MVNLFRTNDILRSLLLIFLLCLIRLPFLLKGVPLTFPELEWMVVAEKANQGFLMYKDIWDNQGFLAALIYQGIDFLFGRSHTAYLVIASVLLFFQAFHFNHILNVNRITPERTHVPALCYVITAHVFFDLITLSPVLIGTTFLIPALGNLFHQMRSSQPDEKIFSTGLLTGLATAAHPPFGIFLIFLIIGFLSYTSVDMRRYVLMITGFLFPIIAIALFFFAKDGWGAYKDFAWFSYFHLPQEYYFSYTTSIMVFTVPLLISLLGLFKLMGAPGFVNYQNNCQRLMFWWLVMCIPFVWFHPYIAPRSLYILLPGLTFFIAHYLLLVRKKMMADVVFLTFLSLLLIVNYGNLYGFIFKENAVDVSGYTLNEGKRQHPGKKVLVLGNNKKPYYDYQLATPYFDWRLAQRHFSEFKKYKTLLTVYNNFKNDLPHKIADPHNRIPVLFNKLPELANKYQKKDQHTYIKKSNP